MIHSTKCGIRAQYERLEGATVRGLLYRVVWTRDDEVLRSGGSIFRIRDGFVLCMYGVNFAIIKCASAVYSRERTKSVVPSRAELPTIPPLIALTEAEDL
jgi:hypothetical protein